MFSSLGVSSQCRWFQPNVYVFYFQKEYSCFVFLFKYSIICSLSSKHRLFLEAYLWGYSFLSFFKLVFFNAINLLYVYSLNKNITVCNEVSRESLFIIWVIVVYVWLGSQWPHKQQLTKQSQFLSKWNSYLQSVWSTYGLYLLLNNTLIIILCYNQLNPVKTLNTLIAGIVSSMDIGVQVLKKTKQPTILHSQILVIFCWLQCILFLFLM